MLFLFLRCYFEYCRLCLIYVNFRADHSRILVNLDLMSIDQIDDPFVSNAECLPTAVEPKSWNDIFSNLSKGNDNGLEIEAHGFCSFG